MRRLISAFLAGGLFSVGLGVGGMTRPEKVIGFLDFFGDWDASLALVMAGAVTTYLLAYRALVRRPHPLFFERFEIPTNREITPRLIGGAALFGIGWGLGGFCPGPAIASVVTGAVPVIVFVASMATGMFAQRRLEAWLNARARDLRQGAPARA
ncbi:MAG: YeeE/YedE family protein [Myxococcales bacterium]|nr:YeeE/YedE family protein [Myxococcales bacterium]MCB9521686.1 YeeE/YedE family protein [Myxococcales bacterium]MCB9532273.1 YeeE/YedE family protein [Myxococcales bacterium]MCB9533960.1 YeeE/YedE family protein [Myxococcales bacterium]